MWNHLFLRLIARLIPSVLWLPFERSVLVRAPIGDLVVENGTFVELLDFKLRRKKVTSLRNSIKKIRDPFVGHKYLLGDE